MDLSFQWCGRLDKGLYGAALLMPQLARAEIPVHIRSPPKPCVVAGETNSSKGGWEQVENFRWRMAAPACKIEVLQFADYLDVAMELRKSRNEVMELSVQFFGSICDGSQ